MQVLVGCRHQGKIDFQSKRIHQNYQRYNCENYIRRVPEKFERFKEKSVWLLGKSLQAVHEVHLEVFGADGLDLAK